jgi:diaminopimelate epimerase
LIPFTKAHACGNDFLIVTEDDAGDCNWTELSRRLCARSTGIGADGVEFFAWTGPKSGRIRLHNTDGSIAEISGNGTRCAAAWMAHTLNSQLGDLLEIATDAGLRECRINAIHASAGFTVEVSTGMGIPSFAPHTVTLAGGLRVVGIEVNTGNPHFVVIVNSAEFSVARKRWQTIGADICAHPDFPQKTSSWAAFHPSQLWHPAASRRWCGKAPEPSCS